MLQVELQDALLESTYYKQKITLVYEESKDEEDQEIAEDSDDDKEPVNLNVSVEELQSSGEMWADSIT